MVIRWAKDIAPQSSSSVVRQDQDATCQQPPAKMPKTTSIRGKYLLKQSQKGGDTDSRAASVSEQFDKYLNWNHGEVTLSDTGELEEINPIKFWSDPQVIEKLPALSNLAKMVLSVPSSSAPVERLFSHRGIIFRPHRRQLGDDSLSKLIYLKCNRLASQ